jgi:hypothetical protein
MRKENQFTLLYKVVLFTTIFAFLFFFSSKAQELVKGGNMEDSTTWNFYWGTNGPDSAGTHEFNYIADGPAAGEGGCYMVSTFGQSASFLWQPVTITPGHKYLITGAFKNASVDSVQNTWVELFITKVKPAGGDMTTDIGYTLNTWHKPDTLDFDGTFQDNFILNNTATKEILIPDTETQTEWYLVLKAGCWNNLADPDPTFIFLFDEISLVDLSIINAGGNMEDSTAWNFYWGTNGPDSAGTYQFNYTDDTPAAGEGGCYMVSTFGQSASFLWQPVTITPGHKYLITGAFKNASVDSVQNTWVELFITKVKPAGGDMTTDIGYTLNTWHKPDTLDFDGTFQDNFILNNTSAKEIFIPDTETQTEWYLVLKAGCWNNLADPDPTFVFLFDEIYLTDLGFASSTFPIENIVFGTVDDAEDFTGTVNMSWDADSVYLKFVIVDDSIVNAGNSWQVDNIEIYFDMDNSKNVHWPRNQGYQKPIDDAYDDNDYQLRLVPDVPFATNNTARPAGASIVSGSERQVYTRTADGYEFILNIAWDSLLLGFNAEIGTVIGFDVLHSDNDAVASDANRNQITFNSPTEYPYNDPCLFGTLELRSNGTFLRRLDEENPTVPANLAAAVNLDDVVLTWDASTDNIVVHQYIVRQGSDPIDTILAKQSDNTYTVKDLAAGSYSFRVRAVDVYGNTSNWTSAIDATVTSVDENTVASLKLYPNPASDVININSVEFIKSVTITDIVGKEVMNVGINATNAQLSVEGLNKGLYFVTVKFSEGSTVSRIIIE